MDEGDGMNDKGGNGEQAGQLDGDESSKSPAGCTAEGAEPSSAYSSAKKEEGVKGRKK